MQAYRIISGQDHNELERFERRVPALGAHDVRVRMHAVSLNYLDLIIMRGDFPLSDTTRPVAVSDGAGEVVAIGTAVARFRLGDRVAGTFYPDWIDGDPSPATTSTVPGLSTDGMLAEEVVVSADSLVAIPPHLTFAEGSTLPCAGVTAWTALFAAGGARPGNTVLILGTGGVSILALQFAKAAGLRAIVTSSSDEKLARARLLGADETINYVSAPEWQNDVLHLTGGHGVDLVVEVGGRDTLNRSVAATRMGGAIAIVGHVSGLAADLAIMPLAAGAKRLIGFSVGSRAAFEDLNRFIAAAKIRPAVDRTFSFDKAAEAFAYLKTRSHFGKVVITIGDEQRSASL